VSAGQCRFCHCPGNDCKLPDGDLCIWLDATRTVCNGPACLRRHFAEEERAAAAAAKAKRKPSPGTIHQRMLEERRQKQRAARAKRKQQRGAA
jgi:hypothetical protein